MKTSKKIFALFALSALFFASCSNMIEQLKVAPLPVKDASISVPGCVISVTVNGNVPETPKPKAKYKKPDGTLVELEGTVVKNADGTSTIKFDMNPVPADLPEGELPVTVSVSGYDNAVVKVNYVPPKPLHIKGEPKMENPGTKISVVVEDNIPETPKPKLKYTITKPDGSTQEMEVEGTVTDNGDGTKTITYDLDPIPQELMGGTLPITFEVPGCLPTDASVNYIPDVEIEFVIGDKEGTDTDGDGVADTFDVYNSEGADLPELEILTNYHDNVDIEKKYFDQNGAPLADLNGDGKVDWDDVKEFISDIANEGKSVTVKAVATPKPDKVPSGAKTAEATIVCKKDLPIDSAKLFPDSEPLYANAQAEAKTYVNGAVYKGPVTWTWYQASSETAAGSAISGVTKNKFTPDENLIGKWIWAKATQTATGTEETTNRLEVKATAVLDFDVEVYVFALGAVDLGQNKYKFTVTTNLPSPTFSWLVDGVKQSGQTANEFTLDLAQSSYALGWHSVEALCVKGGTPYFDRKSVKKKAAQTMPAAISDSGVTKTPVSALNAEDGEITSPDITTDMEYSTDGGLTWKPVTTSGKISGLAEGTVKIRLKATNDKADSAPVDISVATKTYSVTGVGSVTGGSVAASKTTVKAGESVTLTISANSGYELGTISASGAVLNGSGETRTFTMPKSDVAVSASFKKLKYSVTIQSAEHGGVEASATEPVEWGTEIVLTITPDSDYVLKTISATYGASAAEVTLSAGANANQKIFMMPQGDVTVTATFKENQAAPQPEPGQTGAEDYTYDTSDFLNTKFYYVKDVQWDTDTPTGTVREPQNAYSSDGPTPEGWWTSGSYTTLAKNSQTTTAGYYFGNSATEKVIPTYTLTLYTKKDGGGYEQHVLGTSVIILGLDKTNGFMMENNGYGTFFYTQKGWADSSEGTSSLSVDYTGCIYPTYDEIMSFINGN